jgi:DNA-binding NtrC family response regulator
MQQISFDCVLTDIRMPGMDGVALFIEIQKRQPEVPVILMTAYASETLVQQGLAAGATGLLQKPLDLNQLLTFLMCLKRETTITIIDNDPFFCQTVGEILELRGYKVRTISDPTIPVKEMVDHSQVLLLDMKLNSANGSDLLRAIRACYSNLPVILVTSHRPEAAAAIPTALEIEAYACLYKPQVIPDLLKTLNEIKMKRIKSFLEK